MRALALDFDQRRLGEVEAEEPVLSHANDVLFRVCEVGVCGTDRALAAFQLGAPPVGQSQLIVGHEALGEVVASNSYRFEPGDLVVPIVRRPCPGPCRFCAMNRRDLCNSGAYTERGIVAAHGYFADLAVDRDDDLVAIPPALRDVAILVEPLSVVEKAVRLALAAAEEPRTALVLGAGPIGILSALTLLGRGIEVTVHSLQDDAPILAGTGAEYVARNPPKCDIVIEAAGGGSVGFQAVSLLAPNGVAIILGAFNREGLFPFRDLLLNNQRVIGSVNSSPTDFRSAATALERLPKDLLERMIERVERSAYPRTLLGSPMSRPKTVHVLAE